MTKQEIVAVVLRVLAVLAGIRVLGQVALMVSTDSGSYAVTWDGVSVVLAVVYALLPLAIWVFALPLAAFLLPTSKDSDDGATVAGLSSLTSVAFTVLGAYILAMAIPNLVYWWVFVQRSKAAYPGSFELTPDHWAKIVSSLVQLILGAWLLFGARGLRGLLHLARSAGNRDNAPKAF